MPNANALLSLEEAREWMNVKNQDAALEEEIDRVSEALEGYCNRPLKKRTFTSVRLMGPHASPILRLPAAPVDVAQALTVTVDGVAQTVWKQEADGDPATFDVILGTTDYTVPLGQRDHLYRHLGWCPDSYRNPYNVLLTYTAGLDPIPDDLKEAALYVLQKFWDHRTKKTDEMMSINTPAGSFSRPVDATIPRLARKILDERYRLWSLA